LNINGPNIKKLLPSESSSLAATVKFNGEPILEFHEATKVGVILLLVRHDPSVGVMVKLRRLFKKKKNCQKRISCEKKK